MEGAPSSPKPGWSQLLPLLPVTFPESSGKRILEFQVSYCISFHCPSGSQGWGKTDVLPSRASVAWQSPRLPLPQKHPRTSKEKKTEKRFVAHLLALLHKNLRRRSLEICTFNRLPMWYAALQKCVEDPLILIHTMCPHKQPRL